MTLFYFYFIKIASELRQNCVDGINETLDIFERISFRLKNRLILSRWHSRKWEHGKHFKSHSKTQTKTKALNDCQIIIVLQWKPINVITEYYHLVTVIKLNLIYLSQWYMYWLFICSLSSFNKIAISFSLFQNDHSKKLPLNYQLDSIVTLHTVSSSYTVYTGVFYTSFRIIWNL